MRKLKGKLTESKIWKEEQNFMFNLLSVAYPMYHKALEKKENAPIEFTEEYVAAQAFCLIDMKSI